jgi:hypothetical protein
MDLAFVLSRTDLLAPHQRNLHLGRVSVFSNSFEQAGS